MGTRTRSALARHGLTDHAHRSRQFRAADAAEADLVVVMEPLHLHWMRRNLPSAHAPITGSLAAPGEGPGARRRAGLADWPRSPASG